MVDASIACGECERARCSNLDGALSDDVVVEKTKGELKMEVYVALDGAVEKTGKVFSSFVGGDENAWESEEGEDFTDGVGGGGIKFALCDVRNGDGVCGVCLQFVDGKKLVWSGDGIGL